MLGSFQVEFFNALSVFEPKTFNSARYRKLWKLEYIYP
jgi:hypothetical protein